MEIVSVEQTGLGADEPALPSCRQVADLLTGLLGRAVSVRSWRSGPKPDEPLSVAVYEDEGAEPMLCSMDLKLTAFTAGALIMLPPAQIQRGLQTDTLPAHLGDIVGEVLCGVGRLLHAPDGRRLKMVTTAVPPDRPPRELRPFIRRPSRHADYLVDVDGYGRGKLRVGTQEH